ncbi:cellulose-binding family II [Sulfobacillus acidophilus TPY]|uniref:Cell surface receptor IPT/TIG domain protein n=1 Tax=Sulfobacillus acidophilus (strain ATCC 700253 / DSM 10332 / NAL) TaxID=679936 RepID=G8TSW4_SULAD|nr:cellulose-binding family II [Sulfobacillus acidophilus TPY]AEW05579.1 cell surface receptor IPT/TIG domain protein [Sulfobacillus acidophilus DSM 10332]
MPILKYIATALLIPLVAAVSAPVDVGQTTASDAPSSSITVPVSRSDYGINVFSYDSQLNDPSTAPALIGLGMGMQQFPNDVEWSWVTNQYRYGGESPVSLNGWGNLLKQTENTGLYIFDYDENPTFSGGGSPADAVQLTQYILAHHLPITAIVIGDEEYGQWDHYANLNPSFSATYYATQAARIAQAIHAVDPAMQVGVSFTLSQDPAGLWWDQTVLRMDAPYINFLSVHDYPNGSALSNAALLSALPGEIAQSMDFAQSEISANVPPTLRNRLQIWVTEFNPYQEPGIQSIEPVYGAAMVESAMLWRADGAAKLFIWSYDGEPHLTTSPWSLATNSRVPFGLYALAGDGQSPEIGINTLYPSGAALSTYMNAIGSGGRLTVNVTPDTVIGQVVSPKGVHVFAVNTSAVSRSIDQTTLPPASLTVLTNPVLSPVPPSNLSGNPTGFASYQPSVPTVNALPPLYPGESVTVTGSGFGSAGPNARVILDQNGISYGASGDAYSVNIIRWSNTAITFTVPDGTSGPPLVPGNASLTVETDAQLVSTSLPISITAPPVLNASIEPGATVYPGEILTVTGSGFGTEQGSGFVMLSQNSISYGAPFDAYKLRIIAWTPTAVSFQVPNGWSGPSLSPGLATLDIVSETGLKSAPISLMVTTPPQIAITLEPSDHVLPGEWLTIYGSNFGSSQGSGYVTITQNGVSYGAPGDWYGLTVGAWSDTAVTFQVPLPGMSNTGHLEPGLQSGPATLSLVTGDGLVSVPLTITVGN